ncbi:phage head morphogenesis protein [Halococcus hamelinensis]|uniref:Head morphogenesis protein SPP1 gp7 n=1 Tax=Halococcus hamelinensis 100A6 TaxID=1132509 RepID=M0LZ81_9EURY|nr:phage minor head protein [Halococcus hamelinensis]EMA38463.1 head morphogenesis protein SPP1 gp7 [Halococcus hamelinensis 100A6]
MSASPTRRTLAKEAAGFPPEVERALRGFFDDYTDALDPIQGDLVDALEDGDIDPTTMRSLDVEVRSVFGQYTNDIEVVYTNGTENGAHAGRQAAARRYPIDVSFDVVPQNVLDEFSTWSSEMTDQVMETMTSDVTNLVRGAHKEGLTIDEITEQVDDVFENDLKDWQAERTARTATISSSNAGQHSAYQDASSVVGTEWVATGDGRTRAAHSAANGQVVGTGGTFIVGGENLRYPGDPSGSAGNVIHCRCTTIPCFTDAFNQSELATLQAGGRIAA